MATMYQVTEDSVCPLCSQTPGQKECVQCTVCKSVFHAICAKVQGDNKLASNTMITTFLATSTKSNFRFFCDKCLTDYERSLIETQEERIENLQRKFLGMENKLNDIMSLLKKNEGTSTQEIANKQQNLWADRERLENVKAPPPKSVLVVKKVDDEALSQANQKVVQEAIMENDLSMIESYKNKAGDITVVCETEEVRNQLKDLVTSKNEDIMISTPREIRHAATIVGLPQEYDKEEVLEMLVKQNGYIRKFAMNNKIDDHIRVHIVKPLKNNENRYQIFCDLSSVLREGFHQYNDKLTLGLSSCKVYDRYNVKRCYNCQNFGHIAKDCPTKETPVCGKCSEEHNTIDCQTPNPRCINCVRNNCEDLHHPTSSIQCPSLVKEREQLKKKLDNARLNVMSQCVQPPR